MQGGGQCYDEQSCNQRYEKDKRKMSSKNYKNKTLLGGIFSKS